MKTFIFIIFSFLSISFLDAKPSKVDVSTVDSLDIERYMGLWYEIARFDNWFEHGLDYVTANYTLKPNGKISVINSSKKNGKPKHSRGRAKRTSELTPGKLKVAFFLWFYSDYNILEVDHEGYAYALVGSKNGNYLWILSRTPQLDRVVMHKLLREAESRGYDLSRLVFCAQ